ncbi:MAG: hypothetical protein ACP5D7_25815, partial [Limnospira sp.]
GAIARAETVKPPELGVWGRSLGPKLLSPQNWGFGGHCDGRNLSAPRIGGLGAIAFWSKLGENQLLKNLHFAGF